MKKLRKVGMLMLLAGACVARADVPAVHGMLLFGDKSVYASHLPMFHAPHDYQLILKLELSDLPGSHALAAYAAAKAQGKTLFTLVPERMDLSKLADGEKAQFKAEIYEGHFEQGGQPIGSVSATVEKIVYAKKLDANETSTGSEEYLAFGKDGEYFAAHVIHGAPSFDAIFSVGQPYTLNGGGICKRRWCPEPVATAVDDSRLPLQLAAPDGDVDPVAGMGLGSPSSGAADVHQVIFLEREDLQ